MSIRRISIGRLFHSRGPAAVTTSKNWAMFNEDL